MSLKRLAVVIAAMALGTPFAASGYDPGRARFATHYRGVTSPYRVNSVFLLPGETLEIGSLRNGGASLRLDFHEGSGGPTGSGWAWIAPQTPGFRRLLLIDGGDTVIFQAFVMVPSSRQEGEFLKGYRIGRYPSRPLKGSPFYLPPRGFVEVDSASSEIHVSPHFRLGQFRCKQSAASSAFLVLKEELILRLEGVLEQANAGGHRCSTLQVMSGYRTPYYNQLIGNVPFSAHQWGAAADVFVDPQGLGEMADLNADGRRDGGDSQFLFDLVEGMGCGEAGNPCGGLGRYGSTASHGPFVHLDVRGVNARW